MQNRSNGIPQWLRLTLVFAVAGLAGFVAPRQADAFAPCGNVGGCNSVPDGCGVGNNCSRQDCTSALCPTQGGTGSYCWYCLADQ